MKIQKETLNELLQRFGIIIDLNPLLKLNDELLKELGYSVDVNGNYYYLLKYKVPLFDEVIVAYKVDLESLLIECSSNCIDECNYATLTNLIKNYFENQFDSIKESYTEYFIKNGMTCSLRRNNIEVIFTIKYPLVNGVQN